MLENSLPIHVQKPEKLQETFRAKLLFVELKSFIVLKLDYSLHI